MCLSFALQKAGTKTLHIAPSEALMRIIHLCIALEVLTCYINGENTTDLNPLLLLLKLALEQHQETCNAAIAMSESHRRVQGFIQLLWAKMSQFSSQ